ncbi:hypothetical protein ACFO4O_04170 [Glaciecola siphonariae]|uniref:Uncharacterized protein n=1 Tax=Glaciecola siphonariae TaxID=521012 RepID=A0ABV9LUP5_9ALTE
MPKITKVPGIFKVYGVNKVAVKQIVAKTMISFKVDKRQPTQDEYAAELDKRCAENFKTMGPVPLSQAFSTPSLAYEFIELMKRTQAPDDYRNLSVYIHADKLDKNRTPMRHEKTGKPLKVWVQYSGENRVAA